MRAIRCAVLGAIALLIGAGLSTQIHTYAAPTHAKTKQISVVEVSVKYAFSPKTATVSAGTQVRLKNKTDAPHTITSKSSNWKLDKPLGTGKTVTMTFKKAGRYTYYCKIHPYMKGTIVVK
jgi:plastocyanin